MHERVRYGGDQRPGVGLARILEYGGPRRGAAGPGRRRRRPAAADGEVLVRSMYEPGRTLSPIANGRH